MNPPTAAEARAALEKIETWPSGIAARADIATLRAALAFAEQVVADAERWRWWRNFWPALTSMSVARFVGLDLSQTYVQTPEQMDAVTDAARAQPAQGKEKT